MYIEYAEVLFFGKRITKTLIILTKNLCLGISLLLRLVRLTGKSDKVIDRTVYMLYTTRIHKTYTYAKMSFQVRTGLLIFDCGSW